MAPALQPQQMKGNVTNAWTGHILTVNCAKDLLLQGQLPQLYVDTLNTTNLSSLKERRTQLCCKYIWKMSQNDHPINFLLPKTATSGHSYNLWPGDNNRNIVYADRSCCQTQRSGSFISFASKYVDM